MTPVAVTRVRIPSSPPKGIKMCEQCLVNPLYFGEVLPGWFLIRARRKGNMMEVGDWGMLRCNDPTFVWSTTPKATKEEFDGYIYLPDDFDEALYMYATHGYDLISAGIEIGYNREEHGRFAQWLFWHLSEHIRNTEPTVEDDEFPKRGETDYTIWKD